MTRPRRAIDTEPGDADQSVAPVPRRSSGFVPAPEPQPPRPMPEPEIDGPPSRPRRALPALPDPVEPDEAAQVTQEQPVVPRDEPRRRPSRVLVEPEPEHPDDDEGDDEAEEPQTVPVPRRSRAWVESGPTPPARPPAPPASRPPAAERTPRRSVPTPSGTPTPSGVRTPAPPPTPPPAPPPTPPPAPPPTASARPASPPSRTPQRQPQPQPQSQPPRPPAPVPAYAPIALPPVASPPPPRVPRAAAAAPSRAPATLTRPADPTPAPAPRPAPRAAGPAPTAAPQPAEPPRPTSAARTVAPERPRPAPPPTPATRPGRSVDPSPATRTGSTARTAAPTPPPAERAPQRRPDERRAAHSEGRTVRHAVAPIVVDRLVKAYNGLVAVRNLSFTVEPGRITGFLGPNGAGKTTTLRVLVGLASPTTGAATFGGTAYADLDRPQETVGAVLDANFHPGRTGRNHLRVLAATAGVTDRRVDELLDRVGLADDARRPTGQYSLGMRQRLAIAAALIGNPDYLILDEPANGLDPEGIRWLRQMLRDFAATGRAVLVSSHLLNEVQATVDEIVVIHRGRLLAQMPISDLQLGQGTIRARVSDLDTAGKVLAPLGARVEWVVDEHGPYLRVHSQEIAAVGAALFNAGIVVHELVPERRDLEQEFFAMLEASR